MSSPKVEDALLARDQARALEIQSRRELARVLEARKVKKGTDSPFVRFGILLALATLASSITILIDKVAIGVRKDGTN